MQILKDCICFLSLGCFCYIKFSWSLPLIFCTELWRVVFIPRCFTTSFCNSYLFLFCLISHTIFFNVTYAPFSFTMMNLRILLSYTFPPPYLFSCLICPSSHIKFFAFGPAFLISSSFTIHPQYFIYTLS